MNTHASPVLIKAIEELNERNRLITIKRQFVAQSVSKPQIEAYSYAIWEELDIPEVAL
jgi:hypothetical protein